MKDERYTLLMFKGIEQQEYLRQLINEMNRMILKEADEIGVTNVSQCEYCGDISTGVTVRRSSKSRDTWKNMCRHCRERYEQ